jgi:iron complex outermembrane receptor protein
MNDSLEASAANHGTDPGTSYIQPDAHDHLTIVKGPNSVLYGSSMGGLVIFNETPRKFDKPGMYTRLAGGLGNFGRRDLTADVTVGTPFAQLRGVVNFTRGDNYKDGSGQEFFSFFNRDSQRVIATLTPTQNITAEFSAERGNGQVAFPAFSLMGDGVEFKRGVLGARFTVQKITERFRKLELQLYDRDLDHRMDNFTLRPVTVQILNPDPPGPLITNTNRRTSTQLYHGRSVRTVATFDLEESTEAVVGYDHRDEKVDGNNQTAGTFCVTTNCLTTNIATPFYDLQTISNSIFSEVTHIVNPITTIKVGYRLDYFNTFSGELRDFLGSTVFPTSNSQRTDITNSAFVGAKKRLCPVHSFCCPRQWRAPRQ